MSKSSAIHQQPSLRCALRYWRSVCNSLHKFFSYACAGKDRVIDESCPAPAGYAQLLKFTGQLKPGAIQSGGKEESSAHQPHDLLTREINRLIPVWSEVCHLHSSCSLPGDHQQWLWAGGELQNVESKCMASEVAGFSFRKGSGLALKRSLNCITASTSRLPLILGKMTVPSASICPPLAKKKKKCVCVWIYTPILHGNQSSDLTCTVLTSGKVIYISFPLLDG